MGDIIGCGIHALLQVEENGKWKTILVDAIYLCSSDARAFNDWTSDFRTPGIPPDLNVTIDTSGATHYGTFFLGEHSLGYFTLEVFCDQELETLDDTLFVETRDDGVRYFEIGPKFDPYSVEPLIEGLQISYRIMFDGRLDKARLVIGYDS